MEDKKIVHLKAVKRKVPADRIKPIPSHIPDVGDVWRLKSGELCLIVSMPTSDINRGILWHDSKTKQWTVSPTFTELSHKEKQTVADFFHVVVNDSEWDAWFDSLNIAY